MAGEELPKVTYRLVDPAQYAGLHVLVVGGDSALESAVTIAEQGGTTVTLLHRSESFSRAKRKNRERLEATGAAGRVRVLLKSKVRKIDAAEVEIETPGGALRIRKDALIVNAGGVLPTEFLRSLGIAVETKFGTS